MAAFVRHWPRQVGMTNAITSTTKGREMDDALRFAFDPKALGAIAAAGCDAYASAHPFPHARLDDFLPVEVAEAALAEFPGTDQGLWSRQNISTEKKLRTNDTTKMGPVTRHILGEFNSAVFTRFLEALTGIKGLIPDPYYEGGGLHQIAPGGHLAVHADFNYHVDLKLDRRINAILYLNKDWQESYGGHLELWDREMKAAGQRIAPLFNRCVIFNTTDFSYHGNPDPLTCPEGMSRKSLALYYYSNGRPAGERSDPHSTLFQQRPGEKKGTSLKEAWWAIRPPVVRDLHTYLRANPSALLPPFMAPAVKTVGRRIKRLFGR